MKKICIFLSILVCTIMVACGNSSKQDEPEGSVDYKDAQSFEAALNDGEDTTGKTVTFEIREVKPDSALGYNLWAGEHLNFIPREEMDAKAGESLTVRIIAVEDFLGSWVIDCTTDFAGELPEADTSAAIQEDVPAWIRDLYENAKTIVKDNDFQIDVKLETGKDSSGKYDTYDIVLDASESFTGKSSQYHAPAINVFGADSKKYTVSFWADNISNAEIKRDIAIICAASEGLGFDEAKEKAEEMINSYTGEDKSETLLLEKYNYVLTPGNYGIIKLMVCPKPEPAFVISDDDTELTNELFQSTLNTSSRGYITGTVIKDYFDTNAYGTKDGIAVVQNENGTYCVAYNTSYYVGAFEVGKTYVFDGLIMDKRDGYDGCLDLLQYNIIE